MKAVPVSTFHKDTGEGFFAGVTKWGVAEVVTQSDSLGEVLVEAQEAGDGARDLHHLQGVRQAGAEVISVRGDKDLRLMHQPPESLGVYYAVTISLEVVAHPVRGLRGWPADARFAGPFRGREKKLHSTFRSVLPGPQAWRSARGSGALSRAKLGVPGAWARTWAETTRRTLSSSIFSTETSLIGRTVRFRSATRVSGGRGNESAAA